MRARLLIGLNADNGVCQIRCAGEEVFRPGRQHEGEGQGVCSLNGGADTVGRFGNIVLLSRLIVEVLNGAADKACLGAKADGLCAGFRRMAKAIFKIGRHGQVCCGADFSDMGKFKLARDLVVLQAL